MSEEPAAARRRKPAADAAPAEPAPASDEPTAARRRKPAAEEPSAAPAPAVAATSDEPPAARRRGKADGDAAPAPAVAAPATAPRPAAVHADPAPSSPNPATSSSAAALSDYLVDCIDYDAMSYERFCEVLTLQSKADRLADKLRFRSAREEQVAAPQSLEKFFDGTGGYGYRDMLTRVLEDVRKRRGGASSGADQKARCPMPVVERAGAKVTSLSNLKRICDALKRTPEELKEFIDKELATRSSIDSNNALIIRIQNVRVIQMENIISKYIEDFCMCQECRSIDTALEKDNATRLVKLTCKACGAFRNLAHNSEKPSFQASTVRRAQVRNKQA